MNTSSDPDFTGKRALVTDGTRGIGAAIVERLRRGGGTVITTARSLPPGGTLDRFVQADLSTRAEIDHAVQVVMGRLGGIPQRRHFNASMAWVRRGKSVFAVHA